MRICTEYALGFRTRFSNTLNKVKMDVTEDKANSIDPETYSGPIEVPYEDIRLRVAVAVTNNLVTYFELLRNSCRDLVVEIGKAEELGALFDSEDFWASFCSRGCGGPTLGAEISDQSFRLKNAT